MADVKTLLAPKPEDSQKVEAVLIAVSDLSGETIRDKASGLDPLPEGVSIHGVDVGPDTIFFDPDGEHFEAAGTAYFAFDGEGGGGHPMTESFGAVIKGRIGIGPGGVANVEEVAFDGVDLEAY